MWHRYYVEDLLPLKVRRIERLRIEQLDFLVEFVLVFVLVILVMVEMAVVVAVVVVVMIAFVVVPVFGLLLLVVVVVCGCAFHGSSFVLREPWHCLVWAR